VVSIPRHEVLQIRIPTRIEPFRPLLRVRVLLHFLTLSDFQPASHDELAHGCFGNGWDLGEHWRACQERVLVVLTSYAVNEGAE